MRRTNVKKGQKLMLLLILILIVSVGYALLTTTLNINGTSKISNAKWDIHWENPQVLSGSVSNTVPTIDSLKTTATFDVTLTTPGDYYAFTIDAVNKGTIDGEISEIKMLYNNAEISQTNALPVYIDYVVTDDNDQAIEVGQRLNVNDTKKYKVVVTYKRDIENNQLPSSDVTLSLKYQVTYVQASDNTTTTPENSITFVTRQNEDEITPGDIVGIGETEDFFVLSSDENKTVLLAKYNLLLEHGEDETIPGFGLQGENETAGYSWPWQWKDGGIAFSYTNYWDDGDGTLLSPYDETGSYSGNPYPNVYKDTYKTKPNFINCSDREDYDECENTSSYNTPGYSIAYYVEKYVDRLKEMGAPSTITGRLLLYEEATAKQNIQYNGKSIILDGRQSYWLGSADSESSLKTIQVDYTGDTDVANWVGDSDFYSDGFDFGIYGVRPVIEVPTSALQ